MENRRQIAFDNLFNFLIIIGFLFVAGAFGLLEEKDYAAFAISGCLGLFFTLVTAFLMPCLYIFDSEGVTICYLFLPNERYLWKNVRSIEMEYESGGGRVSVIHLFFSYVFHIIGCAEGRERFYMQGHIRKSLRTKRLIKKYWNGNIDGKISKKALKEMTKKGVPADDVASLERKMRNKMKKALEDLAFRAENDGLSLTYKYIYIKNDGQELDARPIDDCTYLLLVKISHYGETDESRVVEASVELVYERIGKSAYVGVENENAEVELDESISDILNEIKENGIEVYCDDEY